jgi:hypothetical protein
LVGLAGAAQAKPNFSGDWKLNVDKSDFGPMPPPTTMTQKIDHADPDLKVSTSQSGPQGDISYDAKYTTDGKECTNTVGPMEAKSTVTWDGDDLAVTTDLDANGMQIKIKGKWSLSADGKTLTQSAHVNTPQGEIDMKYVLEKQEKQEK